ncbi:Ribosome small subunit-stimulated GTPase EngC [Fructilactobacillus florum 8D]|uniref:Small ribosomal subunit biogenesis GTPase RsgA n=1 Tax=Fructilactobacillus florum 8D TaxID=1221538 RepID=W9EFZ3_9LACO|nr:ribosome small subunit-dependent GTPase A [Fructilactobacillus florum]ETO40196.1 Ribosome small subunit-stimulated GTPase EngC [Fructilactobacillus florum 8D]
MNEVKTGKIQQSLSGFYDVLVGDKLYRTRARGNFRKRDVKPLVGDLVEFSSNGEKDGYIRSILPRRNELVRPPIANTDQAIVVTSIVEPEFSDILLDKELVALEKEHISPLLFFSKLDLVAPETRAHFLTKINQYQTLIGYPVFLADADDVLAQLRARLTKKQTVVLGQTGAGKSTLLNQLEPDLRLATGEISQVLGRGKHTTRKVSLQKINHGLIADTPGFSSFDTLNISVKVLKNYFPEFVRVAPQCKYRECQHINEPQCAVKAGVKNGTILQSRYKNYVQEYQTLQQQKPVYRRKKGSQS